MPLYEESFTGLCDQNLKDTIQLKQRYLDTKAKRVPKSKDKKQQDSIQGSVHVQQKFLKRPSEDQHDPGGGTNPQDNFEPPVKLQCTSSHPNEGLNKFSVEIVQHLEFTTSAANSQPQQISTNVTVKAHTNTSVKSDVSSPKSSNPATPQQQQQQQQQQTKNNINLDVGTLVDCVKQEPDNDFADLNLIGDDTNDEIITSDAFNDLFSDMSNYPEIMKDFDFDDKPESSASANGLKVEDSKDGNQSHGATNDVTKSTHSSAIGQQNQNFSLNSSAFENKNRQMPPYSNMDFAKTELSPAAQTLKQMAEQHQHKNQMGLSFNPNHPNRSSNPRSPYPDFQFQNDYVSGSPNPNPPQFKNSPNFSSPDLIKQEMIYQGSEFDMKRKGAPPGMYKQQYSPYSSPSASSHGSPGYLPRSANAGNPPPPGGGAFGGGTPPRPPSGPGGNNNGTTLQINQAQQLHISQQSHGHNIQVSAGQHLQLSGDLKGNVSIATHQGMHFNQQSHPSNTNTSQSNTSNSQMGPNSAQNNHPGSASSQMNQQGPPMSGQGMSAQMGPQGGLGNNLQGPGGMGQGPTSVGQGGMGQNGIQGSLPPNMQGMAGNMQGSMPNSMQSGLPMQGNTMGSSIGNNGMIGGPQMQHGNMAGNHPGSMNESYSMTQTQTINFTQQTLRQRTGPNVMPNSMGPNVPMNQNTMSQQHAMTQQRMLNAQQSIEQQKLLQQQQMLRQAAMQQHGMVRPPPPDYKSSAGIMQPRYAAAGPPNIRRMPHQSMPPSGPMIRPHNMYMVQQQQAAAQQQAQQMGGRNMYPRQQGPSSMETMQHHGSAEWRHILMQQQQNANFNPQMRPHFQNSFNMNPNNMQQMTALQHQQMRSQQQAGMVPSNMGGGQQSMGQSMGQAQMMNQGNGPMAQMTSMNQQMLAMQQQQSLMQHQQQQQQQQNSMSMTSIHMQQSQSLSMSNQSMTPSQQQHQNSLNNQLVNNPSSNTNQNNSLSNFTPPNTDFSLEFLDNLSTTDSGAFTDQELLNSFDTDAGFNLDF